MKSKAVRACLRRPRAANKKSGGKFAVYCMAHDVIKCKPRDLNLGCKNRHHGVMRIYEAIGEQSVWSVRWFI